MKVLILGAGGLIGHKLFQVLGQNLDTYAALHHSSDHSLFDSPKVISNVDVLEFEKITSLIEEYDFDVILNCVGITKRKPEINNLEMAISVNSLFPHKLAAWAGRTGRRVIHFSTDCVFDGEAGNYSETSNTTGTDNYGKTKALGEINYPHSLTIRSSFIGRELKDRTELLEWCLSCKGQQIKGFDRAFYSGVSTIYMARVVMQIITEYRDLSGLYQLATKQPISKFDLLKQMNKSFNLDIEIEKDSSFETMPTLDGTQLKNKLSLSVPGWSDMLDELAAETMYDQMVQAS